MLRGVICRGEQRPNLLTTLTTLTPTSHSSHSLLTPTQPQREVEEHGPFPVNTTIEFSSVHVNNRFCLVFKCASVTKLQLQMFEHSDAGIGGGGGLLRFKVQQHGPSFLGSGALYSVYCLYWITQYIIHLQNIQNTETQVQSASVDLLILLGGALYNLLSVYTE